MDSPQSDAFRNLFQKWTGQQFQLLLENLEALEIQRQQAWENWLKQNQNPPVLDSGVIKKIEELVQSLTPPPIPPPPPGVPDLEIGKAVDLLELAVSQSEILQKLLDGLLPMVERSALFVIKQGLVYLYAWRGFDGDLPKAGAPVVPPPELEALIQGGINLIDQVGPGYKALLAPLSRMAARETRVFPLRLRRKTVAILMVDSGLRQIMDHSQTIRALVLVATSCLASLASSKDEEQRLTTTQAGTTIPVAKSPGPSPQPTQRPPVSVPQPVPIPLPQQKTAQTAPPPPVRTPAPPPPPPPPLPPVPPPLPATVMIPPPAFEEGTQPGLDPKIRNAAERAARVLVGDIELYQPQKVQQGKTQGRMYQLLKEDFDRSRSNFIDRFGEDVEKRHRIFISTVINNLCDGDASKLGPNPWT